MKNETWNDFSFDDADFNLETKKIIIEVDRERIKEIESICREYHSDLSTLVQLMIEKISKTEVENLLMQLFM